VPLPLDHAIRAAGAAVKCPDAPVLSDPKGQFALNVNRCHFLFSHGLEGHPFFELPNLIELAKRPLSNGAYWSNGAVGVTDHWDANGHPRLTLVDTLANIGDNNSLVILKKVAKDPVYGPLFQELSAKIAALCGEEMRQEMGFGEASILISSPNRITSYHMDRDCNFLFQIAGDKTLYVYDHNDRQLVSHEAREQFYSGNANSITHPGPGHRSVKAYELHAGDGVHIPVFAPHCARVGDNISVAVAVIFFLRSVINEGRIYHVNALLRKLGASPTPPGISPWRDRLKLAAANSYRNTRDRLASTHD
jgi:hypothetical protein